MIWLVLLIFNFSGIGLDALSIKSGMSYISTSGTNRGSYDLTGVYEVLGIFQCLPLWHQNPPFYLMRDFARSLDSA